MSFTRFEFKRNWNNASDFATIENDEAKVRADMQALHDEAKEGLNKLMAELEHPNGASAIGIKDPTGADSTVQAALLLLAKQLSDHVDVDPGNLTAQNIGLLRELADKYGLTDKLAPTVHDALEVLNVWASLTAETRNRLNLPENALLDDAVMSLAQTEFDSLRGYVKIKVTYASSGLPAENVFFCGIPGVDEELLRTDEHGEFFAELPVGDYTLTFRPIIGELLLPDLTVTASPKRATEVAVVLEKGSDLKHLTGSGEYLVGMDAETHQVCALGGGGSGGCATASGYHNGNTLAAGGGGGYTQTTTVDFRGLRGQFVAVDVGAGGAGYSLSVSDNYQRKVGNQGGITAIRTSDGELLAEAEGGAGGGAFGAKASSSPTVTEGGAGTGQGVGVKRGDEEIVFVYGENDGTRVFGEDDFPVVGGGGLAMGGGLNLDTVTSRVPAGGCLEDGSAEPGTGGGSGGAAYYHNGRSVVHAGGSGAVFIL